MNRQILRIAIPNIISNITVPLMGLVSTAIAGRVGGSSVTAIGALQIGVTIFNFIYWNCSFIRMGTSGLTAQAFGAGNSREQSLMLWRAVVVALGIGVLALLMQYPIGELSVMAMGGSSVEQDTMIRDYFYTRIWAVPAGIMLFGLNGWLTGMQNAVVPMIVAITVNIIHIAGSYMFSIVGSMGLSGIALASVVAQWTGVGVMTVVILWRFRSRIVRVPWREVIDMEAMKRFFRINVDIMVRTFCIVAVYTFFTVASAHMGDETILAVNTLLLQLFTLFSYMNDGFAFAAEALTGRFIGARDGASLRRSTVGCILWGIAVSALFVGIYLVGWRQLVGLFVDDGAADAARIVELAGRYIGWIIVIPIASAMPFIMDGIMIGSTRSRIMRNSMFWSTAAYFAIFYAGSPLIGNDALWLAFTLYMFLRGVLQYFMTHRLRDIYTQVNG